MSSVKRVCVQIIRVCTPVAENSGTDKSHTEYYLHVVVWMHKSYRFKCYCTEMQKYMDDNVYFAVG